MKTCPVCECEQSEGLLCHADTTRLERDLADVPAIVAELDIALSKQARIGTPGKSGLARERMPINAGAMLVADDLANTLIQWAKEFGHRCAVMYGPGPCEKAAACLLSHVDHIRRHPAVVELVDEISDAIKQARRVIDRPADKTYLGQCLVENDEQVTCLADVYAKPAASQVACRACGITHDVAERRDWLLTQARDQLFSVQEAARVIGSYGEMRITESTIRSYVSTGQLGYHGKVKGSSVIRLGDLLEVIATHAAKPGRKLKRAV